MSTDIEATARQIHEILRMAPTSSPTHRALHAKGTIARGTFTASGVLAPLTTAAHLTSGETPAVIRFSHPGVDPAVADSVPSGRGMAVKLRGAGGTHDFAAVTSPSFMVRDGASFIELLIARAPDPTTGAPDPAMIGAFVDKHPESLPALAAAMRAKVPCSYVTLAYNGLHTFFLVDAAGDRHPFRYAWAPVAGEHFVEGEASDDFDLGAELAGRLLAGEPSAFDLVIHLGEAGDPTGDPTAIWPERPTLEAGRLHIESIADDAEPIIFDPTNVPAGVELPSDDEILALRRATYGFSYAKRTS
jgi:catalase